MSLATEYVEKCFVRVLKASVKRPPLQCARHKMELIYMGQGSHELGLIMKKEEWDFAILLHNRYRQMQQ